MKTKIIFLLLSFCTIMYSQIITHVVPEGVIHNNDFDVMVRKQGGEWIDLFEYQVQVDMHDVRNASMVNFDFIGEIELQIKYNLGTINHVRIRPAIHDIQYRISGNSLFFTLQKPCDLSVEINEDIFRNLHIFTNLLECDKPSKNDSNIIYFSAGIHEFPGGKFKIPADKNVYLEGGAIIKADLICDSVENIKIFGRGIIYKPNNGLRITFSKHVEVHDIIFINPVHYSVFGGQSSRLKIKNIRSFSSRGWADGIDLMSCKNVLIDGVFMRNSDDCIALYGHRWNYFGDCSDIIVQNSTLWADVAHPIMIGTHGNTKNPEVIENIKFKNIDILNHDEPQINYQGCIAINVSDENLARNITFEDIRIDDFERGQLLNIRVAFNKKYATAPGRGIENIYFKNITYTGSNACMSIIEGYSEERAVRNIIFENLKINGQIIHDKMQKPGYYQTSDFAKFYIGVHAENIVFINTR